MKIAVVQPARSNLALLGLEKRAATDADAVDAYLAKLNARSHRPVLESLRYVAALCGLPDTEAAVKRAPWHTLTYQVVSKIVAEMRAMVTPPDTKTNPSMAASTFNRHLAAVRGVLKQCFLLELLPSEEWSRIRTIESLEQNSKQLGRELSDDEIARMVAVAAGDTGSLRGKRDLAILALLFSCGLRRFEATSVRLSDYEFATGRLRVLGKGNRSRVAILRDEPKRVVDQWIEARGASTVDRVLLRLTKDGKITSRHEALSGGALLHSIRRLASNAGVRSLGCHDLRRSFATKLLRAKTDVLTVQRAMGHAKSDTTKRYDMRGEEDQFEAVGKLPFG